MQDLPSLVTAPAASSNIAGPAAPRPGKDRRDKPAGAPAKAADKRGARQGEGAAGVPGERERSPIQALKASVKKASARNGRGGKPKAPPKSKKSRR